MEANQSSANQNSGSAEVQPQQVSSSNNRLFIIIVISILLTTMITGSVVYFWQRSVGKNTIRNLEQKVSTLEKELSQRKDVAKKQQQAIWPTEASVPVPPSTVTEITNWKTYVNKAYGYSLRYPKEITVGLYSMPIEGAPHLDKSYSISFSNENTNAGYSPRLIIVALPFNRYKSKTIEEVARENFEENKNLNIKITNPITSSAFQGKLSYEFSLSGSQISTPVVVGEVADGTYKIIWFKNKENYFAIYLYNDPVLQEIFSTFKFTD